MAPQDNIQIYIDGEPITVKHRRLTGAQLVALVTPPADHVWLDIADAQDESIAPPTEVVAIEENIRFYTDRPRTIYIDKIPYQVRTAVLTETQLRDLPTPPIADDYGIWKDIPDDLDDPIKAGEIVHIVDGDRFFTKALPKRELHVIVNRKHTVTLHALARPACRSRRPPSPKMCRSSWTSCCPARPAQNSTRSVTTSRSGSTMATSSAPSTGDDNS